MFCRTDLGDTSFQDSLRARVSGGMAPLEVSWRTWVHPEACQLSSKECGLHLKGTKDVSQMQVMPCSSQTCALDELSGCWARAQDKHPSWGEHQVSQAKKTLPTARHTDCCKIHFRCRVPPVPAPADGKILHLRHVVSLTDIPGMVVTHSSCGAQNFHQ